MDFTFGNFNLFYFFRSSVFVNSSFVNRYPVNQRNKQQQQYTECTLDYTPQKSKLRSLKQRPKSQNVSFNQQPNYSPFMNPFGQDQIYIDMNSVIASQFCTMRNFRR